MAERTVKVNLIAQANNYISGMEQAARKTRELGTEAEKLAAKKQAFESLGRGLLVFGALAAAAVVVAVRKFAEFDQAMSNVSAVTQETTANMALLREAALDAGGDTVFTATEAAHAIEELGKAGIATADILGGGLRGALDLAASGQLEVARAAEITGITLKQFNLQGSDAGRVADVLSAGANKAVGSVEDLAQGLKFVGPVADSMNVSLEDTTATLALFADNGIIGEQAGTSLRGVLASLTSPSSAARAELERLNVSLYDGSGRFIGLENAAGQLEGALGGVSDAQRDTSLGILFGNQQVTAARVLVSAGAEDWRDYREAVDDSGIAARIAAERLDNLSGDLEKLGGAFDTLLIKSGSGVGEALRGVVQSLTFLVDAAGNVPQPMLDAAVAVGVVTVAVALAGGAALIAVPKVAAFKVAMSDLNIGAKNTAVAVGGIGAAIGVATLILSAFVAEQAASKARVDGFAASLDQATGAVTDYTAELVAKKLEEKGAFDDAAKYGIDQRELTAAVIEGGEALEEVQKKLAASSDGLTGNQARAAGLGAQYGAASTAIRTTRDELDQAERSLANTSEATAENEAELARLEGRAVTTGESVDGLADKIRNFGTANFDLREANRAVEASLDEFSASLAENGNTFDITTEQGRANQSALDGIASSYLNAAAAAQAQAGSAEAAIPVLEAGRAAFVNAATAAGYGADEANRMADELGLIPTNVESTVNLNTEDATAKLSAFYYAITNPPNAPVISPYIAAPGYATGGYTGNIAPNKVAGVVHGNEFVSTAATLAVPANRAALEFMHAGGDISNYLPAPASYGFAGSPGSSPSPTPQIQQVTETTVLQLDGKAVHQSVRKYDRLARS